MARKSTPAQTFKRLFDLWAHPGTSAAERANDHVAKAGATFKSLADNWADTTTPHGRLLLTVLGGLADFERDLIKARTGEGRDRAKARGVHFGPKFKLTQHQRKEAKARHEAGETFVDIGKSMNVSYMTIARAVTRMEDVR
jgi:DNA invertase Pin-like site-specific DNA recombinase